jgi:hypothetical protein
MTTQLYKPMPLPMSLCVSTDGHDCTHMWNRLNAASSVKKSAITLTRTSWVIRHLWRRASGLVRRAKSKRKNLTKAFVDLLNCCSTMKYNTSGLPLAAISVRFEYYSKDANRVSPSSDYYKRSSVTVALARGNVQ